MKNLLKKISEINSKHWGLVLESNPTKYKDYHSAYMAEIEKAIQEYAKTKEFSFKDLEVWGSNSGETGITLNCPEKGCTSVCLKHKPSGKIGYVNLIIE